MIRAHSQSVQPVLEAFTKIADDAGHKRAVPGDQSHVTMERLSVPSNFSHPTASSAQVKQTSNATTSAIA